MPSTHLSLNYHFVFATKDHNPVIAPEWRPRLHAFLGGCARTAEATALAVGGVADHVHLLIALRATHRVSDFMREIKTASSQWVHETIGLHSFAWQEGYGGFTVSTSQLEAVRRYIERQEIHHKKRTFREEYVEFLQRHAVEFDPQFVF